MEEVSAFSMLSAILPTLLPVVFSVIVIVVVVYAINKTRKSRQDYNRYFGEGNPSTPAASDRPTEIQTPQPLHRGMRRRIQKAPPHDRQLPNIELESNASMIRKADVESIEARKEQLAALYKNGLLTLDQYQKRVQELEEYERNRTAGRWAL